MILALKIFYKIYIHIDDINIFKGIIALESFPHKDIIDDLDALIEEDYSFIPTTLEAYTEFKTHQNTGDISKFKDILTENISC